MRLTIERLRTMVLAAGVLLVAALVGFLAFGRWKSHLIVKEIPKKLGINIQQEANGFTHAEFRAGHALFKITASKVEQLKNDHFRLHEAKIELYGEDGSRVDKIEGHEFEYDRKQGKAIAAGPVEITIMRPGVAPAVAPGDAPAQAIPEKAKGSALASAAETAAAGQIHVKTSGLIFDQKSGQATTQEHVEFATLQGKGSSTGALFDSQKGSLILDRAVELSVRRGTDTVLIHAQHAQFERDQYLCTLSAATADYRGSETAAGEARILLRADGSAVRLDATNGFSLSTAAGARVSAPTGQLEFNERNQPRHSRLEGGVTLLSEDGGRQLRGSSPTADFEFTGEGELRHAHLERGVTVHSEQEGPQQAGQMQSRVVRDWRSPEADIDFRGLARGRTELTAVHGRGGVVLTDSVQRASGAASPSRMMADQLTANFGPKRELTEVTGLGHAGVEQTTLTGTRETVNGDRLEAYFVPSVSKGHGGAGQNNHAGATASPSGEATQIQSAVVDGNVVLVDQPAAKPGAPTQPPLRATAGHAVYEATGEWLHLTVTPRVENGNLQLSADKVDVSRVSGDAFAHGNVKSTWLDSTASQPKPGSRSPVAENGGNNALLGGRGPAHVVAAEAQLHRVTGETTFRGQARLWQQANSIEAPTIVLDRIRQTLVARSSTTSEPVRLVLLDATGTASAGAGKNTKEGNTPSLIRVRAGDLKYSGAQRKAVLHAAARGSVVADTGGGTSSSDEVELVLLPSNNHAGRDGSAAQVDHLTARGHVALTNQGRRGTGEQLVYSGETGEYVLTGTVALPPRLADPARGTISGEALIFNSRDDSVRIEGQGHKTTAETRVPR